VAEKFKRSQMTTSRRMERSLQVKLVSSPQESSHASTSSMLLAPGGKEERKTNQNYYVPQLKIHSKRQKK
jgi:hypothetical protein